MNVVFTDGTENFTPDRKDTKACGGILTSLTVIPKYLASKGMDVTVKSTFKEKCTIDGVKYVPIDLKENLPRWNVLVVNRNGINLPLVRYAHKINSKVVWWLHDIVDMRYLEDSAFREVDKIIALSTYCKTSYSRFYELPEERFEIIPNGVDKTVFYPGKYEDRKPHRMIMASALIKGYAPIADTWENVKRRFPDAELLIYSSQALHDKVNSVSYSDFLKAMEGLGAKVMEPVPQAILADKMRSAGCLLMPNTYPEICSNVMLQAQACGLPVVSSNIGSANEFIKTDKSGVLTPYYPHDMWLWIKCYAESVIKLLDNPVKHKQISERAPRDVKSWTEIGNKWYECLSKLI